MNARSWKCFVLAAVAGLSSGTKLVAEPLLAGTAGSMSSHGDFDVMKYGAQADGKTDDTAAVQAAIDAAAAQGGRVVLPPGEYLLAGNLEIKEGVALVGANASPMSIGQRKGTILLPLAGRNDEEAAPFIHMKHATTVCGVTIYYPEQKCDVIVPYPWTFQLEGFDTTVENVTLINSYNGIRTGPGYNVRHRIRSVVGTVLRRGILVDMCTDIGRIENVQFHCHWWSDAAFEGRWKPVYKYMWENLEAFAFGRTDWEYITNNFVFPANIGWRFIKTEAGMSNGHMTACGADSTQTAIQVEDIQLMGLLITGGQFVSFMGEEPVQVRIAPSCTGNVRFVNCSFWGPAEHNALIDGNGFVSFSDCFFSNWNEKAKDKPLVVARAGRVQIQNSTFGTAQPSVELGPEVKHAIVRGNNGIAGVRVINNAPRTIISDNEEDPIVWNEEALGHFQLDIGAEGDARYLSGWMGPEPAREWQQGGQRRWSSANSVIDVPIRANTPYKVELDVHVPVAAIGPASGLYAGDSCVVPIVDARTGVFAGTLAPQDRDTLQLQVKVKNWVPAEVIAGSDDQRVLGVAVRSITLCAQDASSRVFSANTGEWSE
jgi:hypothetical protein